MTEPHNIYTGAGGVHRGTKVVESRSGDRYVVDVWRAHIRIGGRQCETTYSIQKHGSAVAKAMAETWISEKRELKSRLRRQHEEKEGGG